MVPFVDYERLQKNYKELRYQNEELHRSDEKNVRRMQGITALLQELIPDIHIPAQSRMRLEEIGLKRETRPQG